jgi:hypothetical protein
MSGAAAAVAAPDAGAELVSCCVAETSPARRRILTGRPLGQGVHQPDRAWVLVGREPIADELLQLIGIGLVARLEGDRGADFLAELRVLDPDDGGRGGVRFRVRCHR